MTGVETVLLRVAGTAAGTLIKSLLARAPGAGLAADPARPPPAGASPRRNSATAHLTRRP